MHQNSPFALLCSMPNYWYMEGIDFKIIKTIDEWSLVVVSKTSRCDYINSAISNHNAISYEVEMPIVDISV